MAENSKIEWTSHTFNPWRGCSKVAPGCQHCYAEVSRPVKAFGTRWGTEAQGGTRTLLAEAGWREPEKWNREAREAFEAWRVFDDRVSFGATSGPSSPPPERPRVFCASLADVFEDWDGPMVNHLGQVMKVPPAFAMDSCRSPSMQDPDLTMDMVRARLFRLIDATPNLDWLLLTKRPENVRRMWPTPGWNPEAPLKRDNVWIITSVSEQETAERNIPHLMALWDLCPVLGVSAEPLLGPVNPRKFYDGTHDSYHGASYTASTGPDWWIIGGESDQPGQPKARPCEVWNVRSIVKACRDIRVPCFVKQLGDHVTDQEVHSATNFPTERCWPDETIERWLGCVTRRVPIATPKGGDPSEWPEDLRVRQFPEVSQ